MTGTGSGDGLRVAVVSPFYEPHVGGVESHVGWLARNLSGLGHSVTVLAQETDRRLLRHGPTRSAGGVDVLRFASAVPSSRYPVAPGVAAHLRRHHHRFDVVHVHGYHSSVSLAALALPDGLPVVFTPHYHGGGHTGFARALHVAHRPLGRALMGRADAIIAVSAVEAELIGRHFPAAAIRVRVIPNGVRVHGPRRAGTDRRVLLTVSRLETYKRLDRVLDVLRRLPPEWQLDVVGHGSQAPALAARAERLGVGGRVRFRRDLTDEQLALAYSTASAYISLSEHEAFGISVLEAAASGVPTVASAIPAHRELRALTGGAVVTTDESDPDAVAALVVRTASAPVDTGWAARLAWPAVARDTALVYRRLAGGGAP